MYCKYILSDAIIFCNWNWTGLYNTYFVGMDHMTFIFLPYSLIIKKIIYIYKYTRKEIWLMNTRRMREKNMLLQNVPNKTASVWILYRAEINWMVTKYTWSLWCNKTYFLQVTTYNMMPCICNPAAPLKVAITFYIQPFYCSNIQQ